MIYRIATADDWQRAVATGRFESADLAAEGFIHASELHQVLRTAHKYYRGATGLTLLEIDEAALGATLRREDLTGSGMFPHVYAPIPLSAVLRHFAFRPRGDGDFELPAGLASSSAADTAGS